MIFINLVYNFFFFTHNHSHASYFALSNSKSDREYRLTTKSLSQYYFLKMHRVMTGSIQGKQKIMRQKTRHQLTKIYKIVTFQEIRIQLRYIEFTLL